jgi:UDP-2,3-diacylglucosamine pyrophosphatase LpxH
MSRKGVKVKYIIGNHDFQLEFLTGQLFGDIEILEKDKFISSNGLQYLVLHGHQADGFILQHPWLYWLGDTAYEFSVFINKNLNRFRSWFGLPYWSLSLYLKGKVKGALSFVNKVDDFLLRLTQDNECQGVIYGHTHLAKNEVKSGFNIINTGCGTEYVSYVIDDGAGSLKLIYFT